MAKTTERRDVGNRAGVLGCSDIGAIYNASTYKTAREVAEAYLGAKKEISPEQQKVLDMGHALEPVIADLITKFYGMRLKSTQNRYLYKADTRFGCHPDRLVVGRSDEAVEIKSSSAFDSGRWGAEDTDEVPYDYLLQCYGYFMCIPRLRIVYLFRFSNNRLTRYIIEKPEQAMLDSIGKYLTEWMDKVDGGWMPEPVSYKEATRAFEPKPGTGEAPLEISALIGDYNGLSDQIKALESKQDIIKLSIVKYLNENSLNGLYDDTYKKTLCTYVTTERSSIDSKMLKEKYPEIANECTKTSAFNQLKINRPKNN